MSARPAPGRASTKTRSSPTFVRRSARDGEISRASSSVTNLPLASRSPAETSSATASTRPEPQMPNGSVSSITASSTSPSRILTPSIAPSEARMPQRIWAASKAGPAGAAVASARTFEPSAISLFVPTSMKRRTRRSSVSPVASSPATMSPPT